MYFPELEKHASEGKSEGMMLQEPLHCFTLIKRKLDLMFVGMG